ncbi:MAG: helix-turn-helix domain-containing protein [Victivallaceae bacterium]
MTEDQLLLSGLLRDMLRGDFTELIVSLPGREPRHINQSPRLVWVIEGVAPIKIGGPHAESYRQCPAGSVVLAYPGATSDLMEEAMTQPSRTLAIRFLPDLVRLATYRFDAPGDWGLVRTYHLPSALPRLGQTMFSLLLQMAVHPGLGRCAEYQIRTLLQLVLELATHAAGEGKDPGKSEHLWRRIAAYLESRLETPLSRYGVAAEFKVNPSYLSTLCRKQSGFSFSSYINELRLVRALLLLEMNLSLGEISERCGFQTTNYFIRCFKRKYGSTPARYRRLPLPELTNRDAESGDSGISVRTGECGSGNNTGRDRNRSAV